LKIVDEKLNFLCLDIGSLNVSVACGAFFIWSTKTKNLTSNRINYKSESRLVLIRFFHLISYSTAKFDVNTAEFL
jgi:hypothetical protein